MTKIAFDLETVPFKTGDMAPPIVCLSYKDETGGDGLYDHKEAREWLKKLLGRREWIGHNCAYDFACIVYQYPELTQDVFKAYDEDRVTDTMIRQQLIDIAEGCYREQGYSLGALAKKYCGIDLDKTTWRTGYAALRDTPIWSWPAGAKQYAIEDSKACHALYLAQVEKAERLLSDEFAQARSSFWLQLSSVRGLRTDPVAVRSLKNEAMRGRDEVRMALYKAGLIGVDGKRNVKRAAELVVKAYAKLGVAVPRNKDTGSVQTDAAVCEASGDELLKMYSKYCVMSSVIDKDIPMLSTPIVHTHYGRAASGRTTSYDPNIQNLRRG